LIPNIEKLNPQRVLIKKGARKRMKMQKIIHRLSVRAQRKKLQLMFVKQKENAYMQIETKQAVIIPMIMNTRIGFKTRKKKRRIVELNTGRNLFSYSTILSGDPLNSLRYSSKYSTIADSRLLEQIKNFREHTLIPDLNFTDLFFISHKHFPVNSIGISVIQKNKEVFKKQLTITPGHHVSRPRNITKSRMRTSKQVKQ
jgi:hypothetical protein